MFAETEAVFRYSSLRAFLIVSAVICVVGGVVLAFLLDPDDYPIVLGLCAGAALFCAWGAYLVGAEVEVTKIAIGWKRGRRSISIPWSQLEHVEQRSERLILRSQDSKITVDKQLDDYTQFCELVRKYASPSVWKTVDFPLRCRARLGLPGFIVVLGLAWAAFIGWLADYSPPSDDVDLAIVLGAAGFGACLALFGLYLATFRCEFDLQQIRAGGLFLRKTYNVADLVEMKLATEYMDESPAATVEVTAPIAVHLILFRFKDGRELKLRTQRISVDPEALYHLLAHYYPGVRKAS
jgi:hypothetical protein